jgi:membrane fusion protein, multidrug efflux system
MTLDRRSLRAAHLALTGLIATACGGTEESAAAPASRRAPRVEPVQIVVAELSSAARSVAVTGTVEPIRTVGVVSQIAGVLQAVTVEEGDVVRAGAVMARIAAPEVDAQLRSAEVALEVARTTAERSAKLFEARVLTAPEYERDQAALAAARATRDQLRTRRSFATVRAPSTGVVLSRNVEAGDLASPQLRLFTVADVSTLVVRVPVSELHVASLRVGGPAEVSLDALPGRKLHGTIRRIFPAGDSTTRLVPVEVALTGASAGQTRPGFLARVTFRLAPRDNVLLVPGTAVLENPRGAVVYVVRDGKANLRPVERGMSYEGRVEITNGIAVGDSVVVAGGTMLRDGAPVRVIQREDPTAPPADSVTGELGAR